MLKKISWAHGLAFALIGFMIFILSLIYIYQNKKNTFDLVTEEYYKDELLFQNQINAKKNTNLLENQPTVNMIKNGFLVNFPLEIELKNFNGKVYLRHSFNKSLDISENITLNKEKTFLIPSEKLVKSNYELILTWQNNSINYRKDFSLSWK